MFIHHLIPSGIPQASQTLARAFRDDPLVSYMVPELSRRELLLLRFYRWLLRYGLTYGEIHVSSPGHEAVAMWLPPEASHGTLLGWVRSGALLLPFRVGPRFLLRCWKYADHISQLRLRHTPFPHWFLQLLGVAPDCQRQGHATRLLGVMLQRLERAKVPCCLDTVRQANVDFYERFGFRVAEESHVPGTNIDCWLMVRTWAGERTSFQPQVMVAVFVPI